jgi:nucleoside-triphosphatase
LKKRIFLLTGNPGVGKTTVLLKAIESFRAKGYSVGGMISREVRSCGTRVGFEISDLSNGAHGWLAHVNQKSGPQIGKYRVNLKDLEGVGVVAVMKAIEISEVVAIDEYGPMELFSGKFKEAVRKAIESDKLLVGIVHWKARDKLIDEAKAREDAEVYVVTCENRASLHEVVVGRAVESRKHK